MTTMVDDDNKLQGIVLLTSEASKYLNPREEIAYKQHRRELAEWMLNLGKDPAKAEGYSHSTAKNRMNKLDLFYRWVWNNEQRFVQDLTVEHADDWMRHLARQDMKESTKNHYQKAAKALFKWMREAQNRMWSRSRASSTATLLQRISPGST
jgi:Phage integrase, N-terminal SAM-like domain.